MFFTFYFPSGYGIFVGIFLMVFSIYYHKTNCEKSPEEGLFYLYFLVALTGVVLFISVVFGFFLLLALLFTVFSKVDDEILSTHRAYLTRSFLHITVITICAFVFGFLEGGLFPRISWTIVLLKLLLICWILHRCFAGSRLLVAKEAIS